MGMDVYGLLIYGIYIGEEEDIDQEFWKTEDGDFIYNEYDAEPGDPYFIYTSSYDYPLYYFGYKIAEAYWGETREIEANMFMSKAAENAKIKQRCEELHIPYVQPTTYLSSILSY